MDDSATAYGTEAALLRVLDGLLGPRSETELAGFVVPMRNVAVLDRWDPDYLDAVDWDAVDWDAGGWDAAAMLTRGTGMSQRAAREAVRVAGVVAAVPGVGERLAAGEVSAAQVGAVAGLDVADVAELLDAAPGQSDDEFAAAVQRFKVEAGGRDRAQRQKASKMQRLALSVLQPRCQSPGCDVPAQRCEVHHDLEFDAGGRTSRWDLNIIDVSLSGVGEGVVHVVERICWKAVQDAQRLVACGAEAMFCVARDEDCCPGRNRSSGAINLYNSAAREHEVELWRSVPVRLVADGAVRWKFSDAKGEFRRGRESTAEHRLPADVASLRIVPAIHGQRRSIDHHRAVGCADDRGWFIVHGLSIAQRSPRRSCRRPCELTGVELTRQLKG